MPRDRSDAIEIVYRPCRQPPRRVVFEPLSDGRYLRETAMWTGCCWRTEGSEVVSHVTVDAPG